MTGRDLILYILNNHLEDKPVFENGRFVGFSTVVETAERMDVGVATVCAWLTQGKLEGVFIKEGCYIPSDAKSPMDSNPKN